MTQLEIRPQPTGELPPAVQTIILNASLDYIQTHQESFAKREANIVGPRQSSLQERLMIASQIIQHAYYEGLPEVEKGTELAKAKAAIKRGMEHRKEFLQQSLVLIEDQKEIHRDLGFSREEIAAAHAEYYDRVTTPELPHLSATLSKANTRRVLMPQLSGILLQAYFQRSRLVDTSEIGMYIPDLARQSMVIRGMILAGIAYQFGIKGIDPMFITDDKITELIDKIGEDPDRLVVGLAKSLAANLPEGIDSLAAEAAFVDYGRQAIEMLTRWKGVKEYKNPTSEEYWRQREVLLNGLPINQFTPDIQYIFTRESVAEAIQQGLQHLWLNSVPLQNFVFPSLDSIEHGLNLLRNAGFAEANRQVQTLIEARDVWRQYNKNNQANIVRLKRNKARAEKIQQAIDELGPEPAPVNAVERAEVESRLFKLRNIQAKESRVKTKQNQKRELLHYLDHPGNKDGGVDLTTRLKILRYKKEKALETIDIQTRRIEDALLKPGWGNLLRIDSDIDYFNLDTLEAELALVRKYKDEMSQRDAKALPEDFYTNKSASHYIRLELDGLAETNENRIPRSVKQKLKAARRNADDNNLEWRGFSPLFNGWIKKREEQLVRMRKLLSKRDEITSVSNTLVRCIHSGNIDTSTLALVDSEMPEVEAKEFIGQLKMSVVPEDLVQKVSVVDIEQIHVLFTLYDSISKGFSFTFPSSDQYSISMSKEINKYATSDTKFGQNVTAFMTHLQILSQNSLFPGDAVSGQTLATLIRSLRDRVAYVEAQISTQSRITEIERFSSIAKNAKLREIWDKMHTELETIQGEIQSFPQQETGLNAELVKQLNALGLGIGIDEFNAMNEAANK